MPAPIPVPDLNRKLSSNEISRMSLRAIGLVQIALAIAFGSVTFGQQGTVTLSGSVEDPSGARVSGASVVITETILGLTEATTAGGDGSFRLGGLKPSDSYEVEVFGPIEFASHRQSVSLTTDQHIEIKLEIQPIVEAVVVSGARPVPDPALPKSARTRIRVGGNVQKAKLMHHVAALYPPDVERESIEGTVLFEGVIETDGKLSGLTPVNSIIDDRLVAAAKIAVSQWRYEPARLNGQPVAVEAKLSVAFQLP